MIRYTLNPIVKRSSLIVRHHGRFLHAASSRSRLAERPHFAQVFVAGTLLGGILAAGSASYVHNHAKEEEKSAEPSEDSFITETTWSQQKQVNCSWNEPGLFVWGSNRYGIADPNNVQSVIRSPKRFDFFNDKFLRSVALAQKHAAAVDENGDVYQWGEEFFGIRPAPGDSIDLAPEQTLRGKNIVTIALSQDKLFALSSTGTLYILPSSKRQHEQQQQANKLSPSLTIASSTSWWPFGGGDSSKLATHALAVSLDRLRKGERITAIATGSHHLLALTSAGRVFSAATDVDGNRSGQLGLSHTDPVDDVGELHEVRGDLEGVQVLEVACGHEHSVVRSADGRAFTFGANTWGQLAQGDYTPSNASLANPSEVTLLYNPVPGSSRQSRPHTLRCVRVAAGGANTFFVVDKLDRASQHEVTELYSAGMGQYGQLGNSQWTHMQGVPVRVHAVSELMEYNEFVNKTIPIGIRDVAPGATHVAVVLDNSTNVAEAVDRETPHYGYDVLMWGHNIDWQIGNGRRNNIASPIHPLPLNAPAPSPAGKGAPRASKIAPTSPANRLQLAPETRIRSRNGSQVIVGQKIVVGTGVTAVYSCIKV